MNKLQGNVIAKLCAWAVLLAAAFGAGIFGVRAMLSFGSVADDSWQNSSRYYNAVNERRRELVEGIKLSQQLEQLERQMEEGTASPLAYADAEALREERAKVEEQFSRQNTWFRFRVLTDNGQTLLGTNLNDDEAMIRAVQNVHYFSFELWEGDIYGNASYYDPETGEGYSDPPTAGLNPETEAAPLKLVLEYGVPEKIDDSIQDEFSQIWSMWNMDRAAFDQYLTGFLSLGALILLALVWVLWTAGHRAGAEGTVTTWQERIFFDLYAAVMIASEVCLAACFIWTAEQLYWGAANVYSIPNQDFNGFYKLGVMGAGAFFAAGVGCAALLLRTLAVRLKAGCLGKTTLLCRVVTWMVKTIHDFLRFLPFTWKLVLGFGAYVVFSFWLIAVGRYDGVFMLMYFCLQLVLLLFLSWWAYGYHRLRQGTKTIAKGDLEYQIDTRRMPYDLRLQAEDLNNISAGLSAAVDEKMKSERFKAELITNVSHDLKTPLTSIINYVNLLKSTDQTDPKAAEYIEVLDRKSQRLKKLTEDLVEASKASTGVLSVAREKIGMAQLIDQATAEWEERLTQQRLTLVTTLPEGETWVYADGRHLWRVIDNLLSNCAKYAMEGTRVYLDLERGKGQVALSVKNISREPLNVPAERLMERFVRGEESRSTEGSGLGLSIARSLTELQGGSFDLAVDGDLFKAIVTLPQAN
ncbi:sensor histidine kinase [Flintibacter muris]|uniref:sensor histidine kinase n=1 Tax=Flintibacter muris TaxID=2941327 RepID=UPI0020422597|nr:HAMP domain-containing sensor histidine kinase [Flintibacter muris]